MVKSSTYIDSSEENNAKDPKFKIDVLLEYQNIEIFLQNVALWIGLKKLFWLKKLKILWHGHMSLMKKLLEQFMKNNCKKQIKESLEFRNKSHFNTKSNNYVENLNNFESLTKSLDILSQRTLAVPHKQRKRKH